jgi:HlyD family secretion protein
MRIKPKKVAVWIFVVAVVGLLALALRPKPLPVEVAVVDRARLEVTIDDEGETRVRDRYVVSAPLAGRVLRIALEPGDRVHKDVTVLATFQPADPTPLDARSRAEAEARVKAARARLQQAQAERERAQTERAYARTEARRYRELAARQLVSLSQLDTAERNLRTAEEVLAAAVHAVASSEYELELARAALLQVRADHTAPVDVPDPITIHAPVDGEVLRRLRQSEAVVPAGEPLLEVGDPSDLEIVSDLLSSDAVKVKPGQPVRIEQWGGQRPLEGRVRRVEPAGFTKVSALGVEEKRVWVVIDLDEPQAAWQALGDGYRVEVRIVVWAENDVLSVPTSALFRHGDGWAAYLLDHEHARLRAVEAGESNGLHTQVLSGLAPGDRVVIHPGEALHDDARVRVR